MKRPPFALQRLRDRNHFPFIAAELGLTSGVEIGTWKGEYALHLLTHWSGKLTVVDPWEQQPATDYLDGCNCEAMEAVMTEALTVLEPHRTSGRCEVLRMYSTEAAKQFEPGSLGFAYLDGNHSEAVVAEELRLYWPLIQPGGILGGHDAYHREDEFQRGGVIDAVLDFAEELGVRPHITNCTSFWFLKE